MFLGFPTCVSEWHMGAAEADRRCNPRSRRSPMKNLFRYCHARVRRLTSRGAFVVAALLALPCAASAADVAPTSYPFTLKGGGNVVQGSTIWACGRTLQAQTTSSVGGSISGGVGDTNPNCGQLSVRPSTWSITSATTGVFQSLTISGGRVSCFGVNVPFTIRKTGNNVTSFFFNSVTVGSCNFNADLRTGAALTVSP